MMCVRTYEDLCRQSIYGREQHWYYVILLNPKDLSPAGKVLIESLNYFDLDSGEKVVYFIPGFLNNPYGGGLVSGILRYFKFSDIIHIRKYGDVQFYTEDFVDCFHKLEKHNKIQWRYSGECELLLFNLDENKKIIPGDFYSYNLDDIIRNGRNISSFIRETINIGRDAIDKRTAKRRLDEIYAEIIIPTTSNILDNRYYSGFNSLRRKGFVENKYYFISYCSKDYGFVNRIRESIERAGIQCWMAPRDIPHGTNYAHIIELSIRNAERFILMLSESSIWSVWVEKELQRAIHYFQHTAADKILAVWIDNPTELDSTPMGYTLEGVQIAGRLSNISDYTILLPEKTRDRLSIIEKIEKSADYYEKNMVTVSWIKERFTKLLGISYNVLQHAENIDNDMIYSVRAKLKELNEELKTDLQKMKEVESPDTEMFISTFRSAEKTCGHIRVAVSKLIYIMKHMR